MLVALLSRTRVVWSLGLLTVAWTWCGPATRVRGEDGAPSPFPVGSEIVVKDLFVQPRIGIHVAHPSVRDHRFRVDKVQGAWLWVTSHETRGWIHENEAVPFSTAIDYFTAVIHSHPYSAHAYYIRGLVWMDLNEPDIAIGDFTDAIERDDKNAWAFHQRARAHAERGRYRRAIDDYSEAIRLNGLDAAAFNNRGMAHDRLGELDQAIADYNEAIRHDPGLVNAYYNRAGAHAERHDDREAVAGYDTVIRLAPDDADAHAHLARILATTRDPAVRNPGEALQEATIANRLSDGKNPGHLDALAAAQAASGDWDNAVATQAKAAALWPEGSPERAAAESRLKQYGERRPVQQ